MENSLQDTMAKDHTEYRQKCRQNGIKTLDVLWSPN